MIQYSIEQLFDFLEHPELQNEQNKPFYRRNLLNYSCIDLGHTYSEWITEWMVDEDDDGRLDSLILGPAPLEPEKNKYCDGKPIHSINDAKRPAKKGSTRYEEAIAKRMFVQDADKNCPDVFDANGYGYRILDYQVPVNRVYASSAGKVDLIIANENETLLGELKSFDSPETLLRTVVEVHTYWARIVDSLIHCPKLDEHSTCAFNRFATNYGNSNIYPAVLIFPNTQAMEDFESASHMESPYLRKLFDRWTIRFFEVDCPGHLNEGEMTNVTKRLDDAFDFSNVDFTIKPINLAV